MYKALAPGCIGHGKPFIDVAILAAASGFEGYWFDIVGDSSIPAEETCALLHRSGLRAAGFTLPVEFRCEETVFEQDLAKLDAYARYAAVIGANRCITWILPSSNTVDYMENFELHRTRLAKIAKVLKEHGILFGFEFIGPPSARKNAKYEFIHNLDQMLELCEAVGAGNCGVLLDVWHWDLAGQTRADFAKFTHPDQIVLAHINDAPEGVPADEQRDGNRRLPGATGVLRIADFFDGLKSVGYEGPVVPEPFDASLGQMPFEQALNTVKTAMDKVWPNA